MRVAAHVNIAGLRAGHEYELAPDHPGLAAALAAGYVEDITPTPPKPLRTRTAKPPPDPDPPVEVATTGPASGSGEGDDDGDDAGES